MKCIFQVEEDGEQNIPGQQQRPQQQQSQQQQQHNSRSQQQAASQQQQRRSEQDYPNLPQGAIPIPLRPRTRNN